MRLCSDQTWSRDLIALRGSRDGACPVHETSLPPYWYFPSGGGFGDPIIATAILDRLRIILRPSTSAANVIA